MLSAILPDLSRVLCDFKIMKIKKLSKTLGSKYNSIRHLVTVHEGTSLTGIRKQLFLDRYSLKNEKGKPMEKYPEQMWHRVSFALAQAEKTSKEKKVWEKNFYEAMVDFKFCPAGRFLTAAGSGSNATMINCFVIPNPQDTRGGIIKTLEQVTEISARGGGVGFNISTLRPNGSYLKSVNGTSSGAVSWANLYSVAVHDIIQQGGTRRGALMIMLWDWHPDIEEFISIKKETGKIAGANLSICLSDSFMEAVKNDKDWHLEFPDTDFEKYRQEWSGDLSEWKRKSYPTKIYKTIKARELWDRICESAWESAEPGVVYMDRYNDMNNSWYFEKVIATNVCGEQGLPAWGVCNLSSLNLSAFVNGDVFDFDDFTKTIKVGVRFLDNAVDSENYLYPEIEETQKRERRLGLGTMGLADMLIKLKIRYGSEESLKLIEKIYKTLRDTSYDCSSDLAKEKGVFPAYNKENFLRGGFIKNLPKEIRQKIRRQGIRNCFLTTEAPTGKIALLAGVSSGIEPVFSFSYIQKDRLGERTMYHPLYQEWIENNGKENIPSYFVTADNLSPDEHVKIQALIQTYTDSSISKTVNAPKSHTAHDVKKLYMLAYDTGCKGISYMREGSREGTLIRNEKKEEKAESKNGVYKNGESKSFLAIWERPIKVSGSTYRLKTPVGTAFITVNHDETGSPVETFINIGRAGSDVQAMAEALGRVISKSLRLGSNLTGRERAAIIIEQLQGIGGSRSVGFGSDRILSLPDAIARALSLDVGMIPENKKEYNQPVQEKLLINGNGLSYNYGTKGLSDDRNNQLSLLSRHADFCPSCGNATLVHEMGCKTCHGCGYSEC